MTVIWTVHTVDGAAVRLRSGSRVALKPANLVEASDEEVAAAAPAGSLVGTELTPFQLRVQDEIRKTRAMRPDETMPGPDGAPADLSMWVFRRYGYTEEQNPERLVPAGLQRVGFGRTVPDIRGCVRQSPVGTEGNPRWHHTGLRE